MSGPGYLRRHESALLLVGAIEPEVAPWLRGAGHGCRAVVTAEAALKALADAPAQLIVVDRDPGAGDVVAVCRALRDDASLGEAWLLAITDRGDNRTAVAALQAGADDYLPRPFTRTELLARSRAGVGAAQQRSDDTLLRALMVNVPGAIYRSAWHADHTLALISNEIERISGYPPENFIASAKRTLMSIVHPDDRELVLEAVAAARDEDRPIVLDLHDGAQQRLVTLALDVRVARSRVEREPESAGPFLDRLGEELSQASAELRELARGIHPAVLTDRGLAPAIETLAARAPVPVELLALPAERLPPVAEATAYFTVSEALTNVAKYARATHATVRLANEDHALVVEIRDDGVGGARAATGSGLSGLADRVGACDGSLTVTSPPGEGTLVRAVLPLTGVLS